MFYTYNFACLQPHCMSNGCFIVIILFAWRTIACEMVVLYLRFYWPTYSMHVKWLFCSYNFVCLQAHCMRNGCFKAFIVIILFPCRSIACVMGVLYLQFCLPAAPLHEQWLFYSDKFCLPGGQLHVKWLFYTYDFIGQQA